MEFSRWTQCVWESWLKNIAEIAEKGLSLNNDGKAETLKQIAEQATRYAKEIEDYR